MKPEQVPHQTQSQRVNTRRPPLKCSSSPRIQGHTSPMAQALTSNPHKNEQLDLSIATKTHVTTINCQLQSYRLYRILQRY